MPPIRSSISKRCALLATSISLNREIMSSYSHYTKKGLVYIIITDLSGRQPSSYTKCTKLNIYTLYNVRSVSLNKYAFSYYVHHYTY